MALYPQCLADVAGRNGGAFAWGILNSFRMKPLSGRPAASRKPWKKFCGITAGESGFLTNELKLEDTFTPNYLFDYFGRLYHLNSETIEKRKLLLFSQLCKEHNLI